MQAARCLHLLALFASVAGHRPWGTWGTSLEVREVDQVVPKVLLGPHRSSLADRAQEFGSNTRFDRALQSLTPVKGRFAYVVPGTDTAHAMAACALAKQLRNLTSAPAVDVVGLHAGDRAAARIMEGCGSFHRVVATDLEPLWKPPGYYHDVGVKLVPFGQAPFPEYDRLILMDSDLQLLKSLNFLFDVPAEFTVFTPRAYWINENAGTTALVGITPSRDLYEDLANLWNSGKYAGDMDVFNHYFSQPGHQHHWGMLPANFLVLDSHWHVQEERRPGLPNSYPGDSMLDSFDKIYTVHFTGYQKPWYHSEEDDLAHFDRRYRPIRKSWWSSYNDVPAPDSGDGGWW